MQSINPKSIKFSQQIFVSAAKGFMRNPCKLSWGTYIVLFEAIKMTLSESFVVMLFSYRAEYGSLLVRLQAPDRGVFGIFTTKDFINSLCFID